MVKNDNVSGNIGPFSAKRTETFMKGRVRNVNRSFRPQAGTSVRPKPGILADLRTKETRVEPSKHRKD